MERRFKESKSEWTKNEISDYMNEIVCPECGGARLNPVILNVTVGEKNISELTNLSVKDLIDFLENLRLCAREIKISDFTRCGRGIRAICAKKISRKSGENW